MWMFQNVLKVSSKDCLGSLVRSFSEIHTSVYQLLPSICCSIEKSNRDKHLEEQVENVEFGPQCEK